jgi:hypothetical protein
MKNSVEVVKNVVKPVSERMYSIVKLPVSFPKGKQRQIVLNILERENRSMKISEISEIWEKEFRSVNIPVDGITNSVRYHVHHLVLLGVCKFE